MVNSLPLCLFLLTFLVVKILCASLEQMSSVDLILNETACLEKLLQRSRAVSTVYKRRNVCTKLNSISYVPYAYTGRERSKKLHGYGIFLWSW